ncbi:MAG: hypothetical protein OXT09_16035 [Myxococcales bacterium]|nr:hypothetical protein [Myxococcales bacterium]
MARPPSAGAPAALPPGQDASSGAGIGGEGSAVPESLPDDEGAEPAPAAPSDAANPMPTSDDRALSPPVVVAASTGAAYDPVSDRAYLVAGETVRLVDFADDGAVSDFFRPPGEVVAIDADAVGVLVLSHAEMDVLQLDRLDHGGAVLYSVAVPRQAGELTRVRLLNVDTALVYGVHGSGTGSQVVVGMASGQVVDANLYSFVYAPAGLGLIDEGIWFPSAYPGEVAQARVDETGALVEQHRFAVGEDWLHDVQPLDTSTALVAGHLRGLGAVMLDAATSEVPYEPLWERLWAYSLVGERHAYSATGSFLLCIDPATLTTHELEVPGFEDAPSMRNTTPIGERAPGRVLLHQPGTGLVELDCEAATATP